MSERPLIDWWLAERVGATLAGSGPRAASIRRAELGVLSERAVELVCEYSGLEPAGPMPRAELIGRGEWIAANLRSLRHVTGGLERRIAGSLGLPGPLAGAARALAGAAVGVELGLVTGYLAQRVLGQYDVALVGPARPPRLLFVAPNLAEAQRRLGGRTRPFLNWIALHEATHAVQFASVPWLRSHIGGLAEAILDEVELRLDATGAGLLRRPSLPDPRRLARALRSGDLVSLVASPRQRRLVRELQATMAVVEGYSEHVMDAVGAALDPACGRLRERLELSRSRRGGLERLIQRLLGLDMKLRQYEVGKAFADEVVESGGIAALNAVWADPGALPSEFELTHPGRWLARLATAAA